jgi:hypothetical protein
VKGLRWERENNYARAAGEYETSILRQGKNTADQEKGKLILQLEDRAGDLKITRFYFSDTTAIKSSVPAAKAEPVKILPSNELNALVKTLITTYEAGDITNFMKLFSKDAQTNDRATVQGIREDYVSLFESTTSRNIGFTNLAWKWDGEIARGEARYNVDVQPNGQAKIDHYQGQLWIQVERRDNNLRITHFAFSE